MAISMCQNKLILQTDSEKTKDGGSTIRPISTKILLTQDTAVVLLTSEAGAHHELPKHLERLADVPSVSVLQLLKEILKVRKECGTVFC